MHYILADNQDITCKGLESLCGAIPGSETIRIRNRADLLHELGLHPDSVVVLDYRLFDFDDISALIAVNMRLPKVRWILFSEELSNDFVRRIVGTGNSFSVVSKNSELSEIQTALSLAAAGERFLCRQTVEQLLTLPSHDVRDDLALTKTEKEILREIALGKTTKEIALERCSSFHTINTHRKNIFHKLEVNTAHEATKYAIRAGLIDTSDYMI